MKKNFKSIAFIAMSVFLISFFTGCGKSRPWQRALTLTLGDIDVKEITIDKVSEGSEGYVFVYVTAENGSKITAMMKDEGKNGWKTLSLKNTESNLYYYDLDSKEDIYSYPDDILINQRTEEKPQINREPSIESIPKEEMQSKVEELLSNHTVDSVDILTLSSGGYEISVQLFAPEYEVSLDQYATEVSEILSTLSEHYTIIIVNHEYQIVAYCTQDGKVDL